MNGQEVSQLGRFRKDILQLFLLLEAIDSLLQAVLESESLPVLVHDDCVAPAHVGIRLLVRLRLRHPRHVFAVCLHV